VSTLEELEDAREAAWREYDTVARDFPDCEHTRAWRQEVAAARVKHHAAIRACDRVKTEREASPPPAPEPPVLQVPADSQEPLFDFAGAT
jgi:hypothetical protein